MREKDGVRFGWVSIINHWTVALLFIAVLLLGFYIEWVGGGRAVRGPWMGVHKAIGTLFLTLAAWRICWRLLQGFPKDVITMPQWQHFLAVLVHWALLLSIIAMPISGILVTLFTERAINVFGLFIIPAMSENETISDLAENIHWFVGYGVAVVIFMHVGAVVKHHFIDKDDTLIRMLNPWYKQKE